MFFTQSKSQYLAAVGIATCALLLLGSGAQAQDSVSAMTSKVEQDAYSLDYSAYAYPDEGQPEYDPIDAETIIDSTAPQPGSIFGDVVPHVTKASCLEN
jgi:hypothetical protein